MFSSFFPDLCDKYIDIPNSFASIFLSALDHELYKKSNLEKLEIYLCAIIITNSVVNHRDTIFWENRTIQAGFKFLSTYFKAQITVKNNLDHNVV